jgi:hypothetical protein
MLTTTCFFQLITIVQNYQSSSPISSLTVKYHPNSNNMGSLLSRLTQSSRNASPVSHELPFKKEFNRLLEQRIVIDELEDTFWKHMCFLELRVWDSVCRWPECSLIPDDQKLSRYCIAIRPGMFSFNDEGGKQPIRTFIVQSLSHANRGLSCQVLL